ncbi:MAG: hypothetical protein PHW95_03740 [Patescibacteria group bacterium]|nr:hypothetical protein [Patescibacteria group bacterium]
MSKFKLTIFTLTVLALSTILSGCYKKPPVKINTNESVNQNVNTSSSTADLKEENITLTKDADGWKTYTNKDWGIKFRFEDKDDKLYVITDRSSIDISYNDKSSTPLYMHLGSIRDAFPVADNLEDYIVKYGWKQDFGEPTKLISRTKVLVGQNNNIDAYQLAIQYGPCQPCKTTDQSGPCQMCQHAGVFIGKMYYLVYSKKVEAPPYVTDSDYIYYDYISVNGKENLENNFLQTIEYIN